MQLADLITRYGIRRDSWQPDYQSAIQLDEVPTTVEKVDTALECLPQAWAPIAPQGSLEQALRDLDALTVIDGVRRLHMRLIFDHDGSFCYSGLGSAAVGALRITPGRRMSMQEALYPPRIRRYALLSPLPDLLADAARIEGVPHPFAPLQIEPVKSGQNTPNGPEQALQTAMRTQERELALELIQQADTGTILVDGPLPLFEQSAPEGLIGYVKTLHTAYLPTQEQAVLPLLKAGERSPLFVIDPGSKHTVSWYLRLSTPRPIEHPLSGLVRLEVRPPRAQLDLERLQNLANRLSRVLPLLVVARFKDARSPQNLLPIQALEQQLKHLIGDETLIQRRLEAYFYSLYEKPKETVYV
ncbi:MAG: DNA double-strand break repair nuclease NurA [Candidatus Sericytochromatia bacterium]